VTRLALTGSLLLVLVSPARAHLDAVTREALREAYYEIEVASYCSLVSEEVAAGFRRQVAHIRGDTVIARETLNELRGKAWAEPGSRGLPGLVPQRRKGSRRALPGRARRIKGGRK